MLACFAVDTEEQNQIKWNHLSGTATLVNFEEGTAYEYNAWAFYAVAGAEGLPVPPAILDPMPLPCDPAKPQPDCTPTVDEGDNVLGLDGVSYDRCPATLIGQFSPTGAVLGDEGGKGEIVFGRTRAVFVGCNLDLRQSYQRYDTKLTFEVWNENELKLTGSHDCADGWHETFLTDVKEQGDNFSMGDLKTDNLCIEIQRTIQIGYFKGGYAYPGGGMDWGICFLHLTISTKLCMY
jgi:hypothetical protein